MEERKLIFSNLLNKVPLGNIAQAFNKTEAEIQADFKYIIQKVKNYCFTKGVPPIMCDSIEDAQKSRYSIFPILKVLDLDKTPEYKIITQAYNGEAL